MKQKLVIEAGNSGDMSVGIYPMNVKITIEANVDMEDVLLDAKYRDNLKLFHEDIKDLLLWLDDMECRIDSIKAE
uniref:Uncharacterized protein n=1 Tax=viral metagenome TaxID=1070528 RepID=A0A6M3LR39_9ZZZZ